MLNNLQVSLVVNHIKRLSPSDRQAALRDLLTAFPAEWRDEVLAIATEVKKGYQPAATRYEIRL